MKKRADGRYCKQVLVGHNPNGTRKMKNIYGKTIKEVETKERKLLEQLECGINVIHEITVGEWADIWLKTFKSNIANNTYTRYEGIISNQIKPIVGKVPLEKIRLDTLQAMINLLKEDLSPASIKKVKDVMFQMFKQAVKSRYIQFNPAEGIDVPKLIPSNRTEIPEDHVKRIERFCRSYEHGDFIMCLLYTGMRRGEILALTVQDIDFENGIIVVNKAIEFIHNSPNVKTPKTPRSNRTIPILSPLLPYLIRATKNKSKNDVVFSNKHGSVYDRSGIQMLFRDFNKQYNKFLEEENSISQITNVHFTMHQFRHTFCTTLYNAGIDVKMAQDILGHNSVNVTLDIYTHLSQKAKKISTDKLNEYIKKNRTPMIS